ncbi:MAG TPA: hypothetical protein VHV32_07560 [Candidatus Angelobacter sp.]|nr:hypothetical protein [Candidatus Angelobacter sp.]
MKLALRFFPFLSALLMLGCGGSTTPMTNPLNGNAPTLNGSYSFIAGSQIAGTNIFTFGGPIQTDASGHVTANFGVTSVAPTNTCFPAGSAGSFSGTLSPQGQLSLSSVAINGQTISVSAKISTDGNNFFTGTSSYTISGGCLAGDHGSLFVSRLLTGQFTGSFLTTGGLVGVTVNFGQPGMPNADTSFPLIGTATFTNTAGCGGFTTATSTSGAEPGLQAAFTMATNLAANTISFLGTTEDAAGEQFSGSFTITGGPCDGSHGQVTLNRM